MGFIKTIVDKNTGEVLYASLVEVELQENEMLVNASSEDFTHYNFETHEFYDKI